MPSRVKSVVTRESPPICRRSTAQSSPIPLRMALLEPRERSRVGDSAMRRSWAISFFSESGTAPFTIPLTIRGLLSAAGFTHGVQRSSGSLLRMVKRTSVTCPQVTPGYPVFGNRVCPCVSLTGGTQFVTVNQSFTTNLWPTLSSASSCNCRQTYSQALVAVPVGKRARENFHSQDGNAARKVRWSEQAFCRLRNVPEIPDLMLQNLEDRFCRSASTFFSWLAAMMVSCAKSLSPCIICTFS